MNPVTKLLDRIGIRFSDSPAVAQILNPQMSRSSDALGDIYNQIIHRRAIGSTGTESYSGYAHEEYLRQLLGHERAKEFDKMRRSDTQVAMLLHSVTNPIRQATWEIEPASDDPEDLKDAELIKHILFEDMPARKSFNQFVSECTMNTICYGHAVFEKTYKRPELHEELGWYHGIAGLDLISPKTIWRWNLDPETGGLAGITQIAIGDLMRYVDIPSQYLLVFNNDQEGSNFEGISLLRPCYGNWLRKNKYLKLNAIGIEKFAIPTPIAKIDDGFQNTAQYGFLIQCLEAYTSGQANYLTIPKSVDLTLGQQTFDPELVDKSIDSEDRRMTKAFLANFLELGLSGSGSFALGEDLSDFFLSGIEHIAQDICDVVNEGLISELMNLNRPGRSKNPKLKHSGISDKAGKELSEIMHFLCAAQVIEPDDPLEENIRKRYNLPKKSDIGKRVAPTVGGSGGGFGSGGAGGGQSGASLAERVRRKLRG
jgi:hypothetical protein